MITAMDTNPVFKRRLFSKRPGMFFSLLLSVSVLALPACDDDEDKMPEEKTIVEANASLDAAQETADVNSDGTGTFEGVCNKETGEFTFSMTWSGLTGPPLMMHFHGTANPGVNARVKIPITGFTEAAAGTVRGKVTVAEGDRADLLAGRRSEERRGGKECES